MNKRKKEKEEFKPKKKSKEKREARSKSAPNQHDRDRIDRALSERVFMIPAREVYATSDSGITIGEKFPVLGTTGNVYVVDICKKPTCTCPDFDNGNICKHIFFVFYKVLRVPTQSHITKKHF